MASVNIDVSVLPIFEKIVEVDEGIFEQLHRALSEAEPVLGPEKCASALEKRLPAIASSDLLKIVSVLASLYRAWAEGGKAPTEFAESVVEGIGTQPIGSRFDSAKKDILKTRLIKLLNIEGAFPITAKAFAVMTEHEHVFLGTRIVTDIRPVFEKTA